MVERVRRGRAGEAEPALELVVDGRLGGAQVEVAPEDERRPVRPLERTLGGGQDLGLGQVAATGAGARVQVRDAVLTLGVPARSGRSPSPGAPGTARVAGLSSRRSASAPAPPRTRMTFEPPSLEAIRSGFRRASAERTVASELREVRASWA